MIYTGVDLFTIAKVIEDNAGAYEATAPFQLPISSIDIPEEGAYTSVYRDGEAIGAYGIGADQTIKINTKAINPEALAELLNGAEEPAFIDTGLADTKYYAIGFRLALDTGSYTYYSYLKGTISINSKSIETRQGTGATVESISFKPLVTAHRFTYNNKACRKIAVNDRAHNVVAAGWLATVWTPDNFLPIPSPSIIINEELDRTMTATIEPYMAGDTATYTLDGIAPTVDSAEYKEPIKIDRKACSVIKAVECSTCKHTSAVAVLELSELITEAPEITGALWGYARKVTITAEDGAIVYYTTDGTEPTLTSAVYSKPFIIQKTTTVKAVAKKAGYISSSVATAVIESPIAPPSIEFENSIDHGEITITTEDGANIYYAIDNSEYIKYTAPIEIDSNCTIKAIATTGAEESNITTLKIDTLQVRSVVITKQQAQIKVETPTLKVE